MLRKIAADSIKNIHNRRDDDFRAGPSFVVGSAMRIWIFFREAVLRSSMRYLTAFNLQTRFEP
jgi:hypothetical protein